MSDDSDKTEEPTQRRLQKARDDEGNVPKSEDLKGFLMLFANVLLLVGTAEMAYRSLQAPAGACLDSAFGNAPLGLTKACSALLQQAAILTIIVFAVEVVLSFLVYMMMNKGILIPKNALKLHFDKLNFVKNLQGIFKKDNIVPFILSIFKEIVLYLIFALCMKKYFAPLVMAAFCGTRCGGDPVTAYIYLLLFALLLPALIFGLIDYPLKVHFHKKSLMMSHKDLKDEHKETEGSPEVRQHRNDARWEVMHGVPVGPRNATFFVRSGDVVIGIRYRPEESPAPMIVSVARTIDSVVRVLGVGHSLRRLIWQNNDFADSLAPKAQVGRPVPLVFLRQMRTALGQLRQHETKYGATHAGERSKM